MSPSGLVAASSSTRALRRHVRLRCAVDGGGVRAEGFSRNLSESGAYVIIRDDATSFAVGQHVRVRIEIPDEGALIDAPAEVAWFEGNERDVDGAPAVGIGLELHLENARLGEQLRDFIRGFRYKVLVAGGTDVDRGRITSALSLEFAVTCARTAHDVFSTLDESEVAVLLVAADVDGLDAIDLLDHVTVGYPRLHAVRVALSRGATVEELRALVNRCGVFRCLDCDASEEELQLAVRQAADRYALEAENERIAGELERTRKWLERENAFLRQRLTGIEGFDKIVGNSSQLQSALRQVERVRRTDAPVYIHGETGTGKELVARALHAGGPRAERAYVVQNCAGMTETLLQSTLFGHRKGAFTGADRDHRGVFLEADGGTLFLDEVGELSPATQAMLLRALQEGEITPVGASRPVKVDVRIISATHKDLRGEVKAGRFREDLLYRLVVVTVSLPPLRERTGDVALLARHFLDLHCESHGKNIPGIRPDAMRALESYPWPGNVRELDNEIERIVILADDGEKIGVELLSPHIVQTSAHKVSDAGVRSDLPSMLRDQSYDEAVERLERMLVEDALAQEGGSITRAADRLRIERSRLGKIRKRLGIEG